MLTITTDALDALEQTSAWKRWQEGPAGAPNRSARDLYDAFIGAQAETVEELVVILGGGNMGGGIPASVAKALAGLAPYTPTQNRRPVDQSVLNQVSEELGLYVYLLVDPLTGQPFYVGKGRGLRHAAHGLEAAANERIDHDEESRKHATIDKLRAQGLEPETWILRYGLGTNEYTSVEAAAIDLLMSFPVTDTRPRHPRLPLGAHSQLTNKRRESARGHGVRLLNSLIDEYAAPVLSTITPLLLITLNGWTETPDGEVIAGGSKRYGVGFKPEWLISSNRVRVLDEIGKCVSAWWPIQPSTVEKRGITHVVAVHRGVTRALFEIVPGSWETKTSPTPAPSGRPRRKAAFEVEPIYDGTLYESVVGPHGHRVPGRRKGAQNAIYYWPR